jgi:hypothetical protein
MTPRSRLWERIAGILGALLSRLFEMRETDLLPHSRLMAMRELLRQAEEANIQ